MGTYITQTLSAGAALRAQAQTALDQADQRLIDIAAGNYYGALASVTLASDAFTLSTGAGYYVLTSESSVTDNLATISGGSASRVITLTAASGHTITLLTGGNITLPGVSQVRLTSSLTISLIWNGSTWLFLSAPPQRDSYIQLQHIAAGAGGTFTNGAWQTRPITNEVVDADGHCALSANRFTLQPGTYRIYAAAPAFAVGNHLIRLQNITAGATTLQGVGAVSPSGAQTFSELRGQFTIASATQFEIQHRCDTTVTTNGMGVDLSAWLGGAGNVHMNVELWRQAGS